jgi:hypothetical protein
MELEMSGCLLQIGLFWADIGLMIWTILIVAHTVMERALSVSFANSALTYKMKYLGQNKMSRIWNCMICGKPIPEYIPQYCCDGWECNCHGLPIDPPVCSDQCFDKLMNNGRVMPLKEVKSK